jgi:transposase
VAFLREAPYYRTQFSTSIVDVGSAQLLDVVPGRSGREPTAWLERQGEKWLARVRYATLDLSGPYRAVFDAVLPGAVQVADPFHVVKLANAKLDECRRRVQNELLGHRGRKDDPLYRVRRLLTKAEERLSEDGREKLLGLLRAGDPEGHVATTWQAKELIRSLYYHENEALALEFIIQLGQDFKDAAPPEVRSLGRTLLKWKSQIVAWHQAHVTNGPTEAMNNLIKRVKRAAFGFRLPPQLPGEGACLRRQTKLVTTGDHHTPLKSEEPLKRLLDRKTPIASVSALGCRDGGESS